MDKSTKVCILCNEEKNFEDFAKKSSHPLRRSSSCKVCKNAEYAKNKKENQKAQKIYRDVPKNREAARLRSAVWRKENTNLVKQNSQKYSKEHYLKNKDKYFFKSEMRKARIKRATPSWANKEEIFRVYLLCKKISSITGIPHEVDHAVPLQGKNVCGLHVFQNLQIVPRQDNRQKSNSWRDWE
jgi:5-methylcytosine-specific restriction endonuclease McrA